MGPEGIQRNLCSATGFGSSAALQAAGVPPENWTQALMPQLPAFLLQIHDFALSVHCYLPTISSGLVTYISKGK